MPFPSCWKPCCLKAAAPCSLGSCRLGTWPEGLWYETSTWLQPHGSLLLCDLQVRRETQNASLGLIGLRPELVYGVSDSPDDCWQLRLQMRIQIEPGGSRGTGAHGQVQTCAGAPCCASPVLPCPPARRPVSLLTPRSPAHSARPPSVCCALLQLHLLHEPLTCQHWSLQLSLGPGWAAPQSALQQRPAPTTTPPWCVHPA